MNYHEELSSGLPSCLDPLPEFVSSQPESPTELLADNEPVRATAPESLADDPEDIEPGLPTIGEGGGAEPEMAEVPDAARTAEAIGPLVRPEILAFDDETDTSETLAAVDQTRQRPFEIRRTATQTVLINTTHPDPALVQEAAALFADGKPDTWVNAEVNGRSAGHFKDASENPHFFAKLRGDTTTQLAIREASREADTAYPTPAGEMTESEFERGRISVLQEMDIAPVVQKIINHSLVQITAEDNGFEDVSLIAPLLATIDRTTGQKYTVYPWVEGQPHNYSPETAAQRQQAAATEIVVSKLKQYFEAHGLNPNDFSVTNTMVSVDEQNRRHIHIFDVTQFTRRIRSPRQGRN